MKLKPPILIFLLIQAFLLSCVNNADFDQINIDAEPVFDVPLIFFELDQLDFINDTDGTEILTVSDITDLEIFHSSAVRDNLVRLEIRYDIVKNFNREFNFTIKLLNGNGNNVYEFSPAVMSEVQDTLQLTEVINVSTYPEVLNTRKTSVTVSITPSPNALDPDVQQKLRFRSIGRCYFRF